MATRTATQPETTTGHAELELEQLVTDLTRILARMVVQQSPGAGAATFGQLAVDGLRVATTEEAGRIEKWLVEHP